MCVIPSYTLLDTSIPQIPLNQIVVKLIHLIYRHVCYTFVYTSRHFYTANTVESDSCGTVSFTINMCVVPSYTLLDTSIPQIPLNQIVVKLIHLIHRHVCYTFVYTSRHFYTANTVESDSCRTNSFDI